MERAQQSKSNLHHASGRPPPFSPDRLHEAGLGLADVITDASFRRDFYLEAETAVFRDARPICSVKYNPDFMPCVLQDRRYEAMLQTRGPLHKTTVSLALVQDPRDPKANVHREDIPILDPSDCSARELQLTMAYVKRFIQGRLWRYGASEIHLQGPSQITDYIKWRYSTAKAPGRKEGAMMGKFFERAFRVKIRPSSDKLPEPHSIEDLHYGQLIRGRVIGADIGGSDVKIVAFHDQTPKHSEKTKWFAKRLSNVEYHISTLVKALSDAHLALHGRLDAIAVSSAGVIRNGKIIVSSIFGKVPKNDKAKIEDAKRIFEIIRGRLPELADKVRWEVVNDGAVGALAGALQYEKFPVLGIALGTSEALGFVHEPGKLNLQMNEQSFVAIDCAVDLNGRVTARQEKRSGNYGAGAEYLSQAGVLHLAEKAKIPFTKPANDPRARLEEIQEWMRNGRYSIQLEEVFRGVGTYLGYALAQYAQHYDFQHVMLLGQVMSGPGGDIILNAANAVLDSEFSDQLRSAKRNIKLILAKDNHLREYGQAEAACHLVS